MKKEEILVNLYAQSKIGKEQLLSWFECKSDSEQKQLLTSLIWFIENTHPSESEVSEGLAESGIKLTMTPAVLLTNNSLKVASDKILNLPENEYLKSFVALVSIFKVADSRRRETECKGHCSHEWHNIEEN